MKQTWLGHLYHLYIFSPLLNSPLFQTRVNYTKELWELTQIYNVLDPIRLRGGFANLVERNRTADQSIKNLCIMKILIFQWIRVYFTFYFIHLPSVMHGHDYTLVITSNQLFVYINLAEEELKNCISASYLYVKCCIVNTQNSLIR